MPMTQAQLFVYFAFVVFLYGSPIYLIALFIGWRNKYLLKTSVGLVLANVTIAAFLLGGTNLDIARSADKYTEESDNIDEYLGDPSQLAVVQGRYVGSENHADIEFRYYQFPALDSSPRVLEFVVPPEGVNAAAFIRHASEFEPLIEEARLIVWPPQIGLNPSLRPELFFETFVPNEAAHSYGEHTLIAGLRPRDSVVVYPPQAGAETWLWRIAVLEL